MKQLTDSLLPPRPIVYLVRHAESRAKPYNKVSREFGLDETLVDPGLTHTGRKQCAAIATFLEPQMSTITHIFASPLTREFVAACLAFKVAIVRGVKVIALPELQSMGAGPNGTGKTLEELESIYGDTAQGGSEYKGCVDFRFLRLDWNDPKHKDKSTQGQYSTTDRRLAFMRGVLTGLCAGSKPGERVEVVVIGHSSVFNDWAADDGWTTYKILPWKFDFDDHGTLIKRKSKAYMQIIPVGVVYLETSASKKRDG